MIQLITDGACKGNPGPGGWAVLIVRDDTIEEYGGHEPHTTNNQMELRAVIEGLRRIPADAKVQIVTDSQYVLNGATQWIKGWKRRDWMTRDDTPVENRELWEELDQLAGERAAWEHVRGHAGHPENERANQLAQAYAAGRKPGARPRTAPSAPSQPAGPCYLSLVNGVLMRHATWDECRQRVHGVSGARFKKCASLAEQHATLASWGLSPEAI